MRALISVSDKEGIVEFAKIMNPEWSIILETSLNVPLKQLGIVAPLVREFIVDVKDMDEQTYKAYTMQSNKVVDINLIGEKYRLRKNVHYGSTSSYLMKVYGRTERQFLDGNTCLVYVHPVHARERLILNLSSENAALQSVRITALPLTDEEADEMALSDDESFVELDLKHGFIASKEIDVSALPKDEHVRLGGYGK